MSVGRTSPLRILFCVALVATTVYVVMAFGKPYYRYSVLKSELVQISTLTSQSLPRLREMAIEAIEVQAVPVEERAVRVIKNTYDDIAIHADWHEDVYLFGRYATTLYFDIDVGGAVR